MVKSFSAGVSCSQPFSGLSARPWQAGKYSVRRERSRHGMSSRRPGRGAACNAARRMGPDGLRRTPGCAHRHAGSRLCILAARDARVLPGNYPQKQRAQGMPGARCTHSLVCEDEKAHELVTTGSAGSPGIPCAMVLTAYFVLSPVTGLSCHRRLRDIASANLTPASGRQDHTTSPSASAPLVSAPSRPSHPAATFVTIAIRPSARRDARCCASDLRRQGECRQSRLNSQITA